MKYKVTLNGKTYEVEVEKGEATVVAEYEAAARPAPIAAAPAAPVQPSAPAPAASATAASSAASASAVKAPIPGVILSINATVGTAVKRGSTILVIEAMKMENEIVAPRDGTVTGIFVQKGASVASGAPLFELA